MGSRKEKRQKQKTNDQTNKKNQHSEYIQRLQKTLRK